MRPVSDPVPTAERYRRFAQVEAAGLSPQYERLALAVADDPRVLDLLAQVDQPQQQPNLLLGAIRLHEVATDDPVAALDWVVAHPDEVLTVLRTRFTQTNEAARCALLLPSLAAIAGDRPVALLELGASAGLCLLYDRYRYRYRAPDGTEQVVGDSALELVCDTEGGPPVPAAVPEIAWRAGVDRNPLDASDPQDALWLRCLVWPEHQDRADRLAAALEVARTDPPRVVRAGFVAGLEQLLTEVPAGTLTVVTHTAALAYAPSEVREQVRTLCRDAGAWRLGAEGQQALAGLDVPPSADGQVELLVSVGHPDGHDEVVALAQPHGRRLRWTAGSGPRLSG